MIASLTEEMPVMARLHQLLHPLLRDLMRIQTNAWSQAPSVYGFMCEIRPALLLFEIEAALSCSLKLSHQNSLGGRQIERGSRSRIQSVKCRLIKANCALYFLTTTFYMEFCEFCRYGTSSRVQKVPASFRKVVISKLVLLFVGWIWWHSECAILWTDCCNLILAGTN